MPLKNGVIMNTTQMEERLRSRFSGAEVAVIDLTGTSDHFEVRLVSSELASMSRINQHKAVMAVFADELKSGEVHALSIRVLSTE